MGGVYERMPRLPELPAELEWVVHADSDRFTVSLSHVRPPNWDGGVSEDKPTQAGYIMSHTHKHPAVMTRAEWEDEVTNAAKSVWTHYTEGNKHAAWADELMRRSR